MTNQTTEELEAELADFLGETTITNGQVPDWRADVPSGTTLAREEIQPGAVIEHFKNRSMVKFRGQELPERTKVYDTRSGVSSMVPTAALRQQLAKRRRDGSRVYSLKFPEGVVMPTPIKDTCRICAERRRLEGNDPHRNFYSEDQLLNHMLSFHANEWAAMERQREIDARREDANRLERLMITMMTAMNPGAAANLPEDVKAQIADLQKKVEAVAEEPKKASK